MRSSPTESRLVPNASISSTWPATGPQYSPTPFPAAKPRRQLALAPAEGWLPLLLLSVAVYSVVYSVTAAIAISHNTVLWITTALGLLAGLLVSKSHFFPQAILHISACIAGYWLALSLTSYLAYHVSLLYLLSIVRTVILQGFSLTGAQNGDMVFLFYLSFLCFFLGYFGSWLIYRAHLPWLVALVYVSIMIVNLNYIAKVDLSFLVVILVGSLILLIARVQLASQLSQWKSDGLYTDPAWLRGVTARFLQIASLFVLLILPFSWLMPMLSQPAAGVTFWNKLDNAWVNLTHGQLPSLTNPGSLFGPYTPPSNFFSDQLTITGNVNLPNGLVLTYTTSSPSQGQYLEGFTFDNFDGHTSWNSQATSSNQSYPANYQLPQNASTASNSELKTSITIIQPPGGPKHYIFAPPQPGSFTVPVTLLSDSFGNFTSAWIQTSPLNPNEHYQVTSEVVNASPSDLSAIPLPNNDPGIWQSDPNYNALEQYYLQKPGNLAPEILATAQAWTADTNNTYAAVSALQAHLSSSAFTYSTVNDPIPSDTDIVTWLLHTHKGYCTYYASAMIMMARMLNIPARMVNGFSQGHYNAQQKVWNVDGSDAHSWVQVYFPNFGWINFDPTPGFSVRGVVNPSPTPSATRPPVSSSPTTTSHRPTPGPQPTPASTKQPAGSTFSADNTAGQNLFLILSLIILLCSLVVLGLSIVRYRTSRAPRSPITLIYHRLCRIAGLVGSPPASWQTPYEYTFALSQRFPQASAALRRIADLFVRERWASPQQAPAPTETRDVERLWPRLRNIILRSPFMKNR